MTCFCIGDIHGDAAGLDRLLNRLDAIDDQAELWFVGDLVNRGPDPAGVIRRVRALGGRAVTVLGNHDLSLLARYWMSGDYASDREIKTFCRAPDAAELLEWLRWRPLIHCDRDRGWTMVHAGIPHDWTLEDAISRARELESALRGPAHADVLAHLLGNTPDHWSDTLTGQPRLRYITNALTRQRFVSSDGGLDMTYKKTVPDAPAGLTPWFARRGRPTRDEKIVFGHWSALGRIAWPEHNVWCIDNGGAWGGTLAAIELSYDQPRVIRASDR